MIKKQTLFTFLLALFVSLNVFSQSHLALVKPAGGKAWGYANEKGEVVIKPQFDKAHEFSPEGRALIYQDKQYYVINTKGEKINTDVKNFKVIEGFFGFDLRGYQDGMLAIRQGDKWGFLDSEGKLVIPAKFDKVTDFNGGYVPVSSGGKFVVLNKQGEGTPVEGSVVDVRDFAQSLAPFKTADKKWGFISESGKIVIPAQFESVGYFTNGLAWAKTPDKTVGYINPKGEWVIKAQYEVGKDFESESGLARVKANDKWFYITKSGEVVNLKDSDLFEDFSDGLAKGRKGGKIGFLNSKGEWAIQPQFDATRDFKNGYAAAKKGEQWGFIDKSGKWVVEPIYDSVKDMVVVK